MPASTHERSAQLWRLTLSDRLQRSVALPAGLRHIQSETYWRSGCFSSRRFKERSTTPGRRKLNTH